MCVFWDFFYHPSHDGFLVGLQQGVGIHNNRPRHEAPFTLAVPDESAVGWNDREGECGLIVRDVGGEHYFTLMVRTR